MSVPVWVNEGALVAAASGTTSQPTYPTHQAGDLLVSWAANNGGSQTLVASKGSVLGTDISGNANLNFIARYEIAKAAGTAAPVFTHGAAGSGTIGHFASSFVIRGVDQDNPIEGAVNQGTPTNSNAPRWGPLTAASTDRFIFGMLIAETIGMASGIRSGFTEYGNNGSITGGDIYYVGLYRPDVQPVVYGSSELLTAGTGNLSTASYWRTLAFAVRPAKNEAWGVVPAR